MLDEAERHIQEVQEEDQARQEAWSAYQQELYGEYSRLKADEGENGRMRYRINDLHFKLRRGRSHYNDSVSNSVSAF